MQSDLLLTGACHGSVYTGRSEPVPFSPQSPRNCGVVFLRQRRFSATDSTTPVVMSQSFVVAVVVVVSSPEKTSPSPPFRPPSYPAISAHRFNIPDLICWPRGSPSASGSFSKDRASWGYCLCQHCARARR